MTEDRKFKNTVRKIAELNDLSYTEAKEAVIALKNVVEENKADPNSEISQFLQEEATVSQRTFPIDKLLHKNTEHKTVKYLSLPNTSYSHIDRLHFTSRRKPMKVDFGPWDKRIQQVPYTNVLDVHVLCTKSENVRMVYFSLIEDFGVENAYFVSSENFFSQMPKILSEIEAYDGKDDLLLGIVAPSMNDYANAMTPNQQKTYTKLLNRVRAAVQEGNICLISNRNIVRKNSFNIGITDASILETILDSQYDQERFEWSTEQIKYYPFLKNHGGSYHRSMNEIVLGHIEGVPLFNVADVVLIEADTETCSEKLRQVNKQNGEVTEWNNSLDAEKGLNSLNNMFLKINFEMTKSEINKLVYSIRRCFGKNGSGLFKSENLVIESPDAERIGTALEKPIPASELSLWGETTVTFEKYTLNNNYLYHEETGEISLYKS